jgi:transposase
VGGYQQLGRPERWSRGSPTGTPHGAQKHTDAIRADLKERGIKPVIPPKSNRTATICYSKRLYRQRNCIERVLGHLKINRAIATPYDQLAESFLGMLFIASARYWIKFVQMA